MAVIIHSFSLNILPKMSCGVLECDIVVTELHAYDFVIKRGVIFAAPCIWWCIGGHLFTGVRCQ